MSHKALPAATGPEKSTLNRKFVSHGDPQKEDGPFIGLLFQEMSRTTYGPDYPRSTITLKFYRGVKCTVPLSDYEKWKVIDVEV